ncbi:hypothetical protein [Rhodanobacter sp. C01]|uniref:hypothetical protein n=1 Tax=Rhodanobacter sp. C01 TaxID=1945856 RepID=UPI0009868817|nr:hypothetical protein [Rhodanobacter sp. C01]OOG48031.1 hypothetical protein B0E50_11505 [Rhodanobacter sp. C01]
MKRPLPDVSQSTPRLLLRGLVVLGMCWTLPNSLLGLLAGIIGCAFGARMHWQGAELAVVVRCWPWPWGTGGALTLGNVILHTGERLDTLCFTYAHRAGYDVEPPVSLADHERAHVHQYMLLGPLFLPLYMLCGGVSVRNPFERAADRYAQSGRGWWPWTSHE